MNKGLIGTFGTALLLIGALDACDAQVNPGYQGEPLLTLKGRVEALQLSPPEADVGVLWFTSDARHGCSGPERSVVSSATGSYSPDVDYACTQQCDAIADIDFDPEQLERWESCQRACGADVTAELFVEYHPCVSGAVGQTAPVVGDFPAQFSLDMLLPPPARALMPSDTGEHLALGYFIAVDPQAGSLSVSFDREAPAWLLGGSGTHVLAYAADPIDADSSWGLYLGRAYDVGYHLLRVQFGTRCGLPEDVPDEPGSTGGNTGLELGPLPDTEPMLAPPMAGATPAVEGASAEDVDLPDYRGVPFVCGNGVCEAGEDCRNCSDCGGCEAGAPGQSTGILYGQSGYACTSTSDTLVAAAAGSEADIQLLIAPPELIEWPSL